MGESRANYNNEERLDLDVTYGRYLVFTQSEVPEQALEVAHQQWFLTTTVDGLCHMLQFVILTLTFNPKLGLHSHLVCWWEAFSSVDGSHVKRDADVQQQHCYNGIF